MILHGGPWPYYNRDGGSGGPWSSNFRDGSYGGPWSSNFQAESRKRAAYNTPPQSRIFGGSDDQTIIVKGFDSSLPGDDIKSELSKYFSSCGEIISLVVEDVLSFS
ncbi:hypothetical protein AALP_AAs47265U000200 [Arabis alpina]|uniref:RRM domain-containing protein n=1 Tax=Arabis alpina TaxID=50452 RepID=A0A087G229_ARAAL|nr:hypothetical protein AALP_AAs47265U000200 [Arabis alpina]